MKPYSKAVTAGGALLCICTIIFLYSFTRNEDVSSHRHDAVCCTKPVTKACVFRTLAGFETFDTSNVSISFAKADNAMLSGLNWLARAQLRSGGWGSGSHYNQHQFDPHAVEADPASTALAAMAFLRSSEKPFAGEYANQLRKACEYILQSVSESENNPRNITSLTNTQPQTKLGRNIDVILAAQFLTNCLQFLNANDPLRPKLQVALQKCVVKIQHSQDQDGAWKDGGWAPVLQSALANNALESAKDAGVKVDDAVLEKSRNYQKGNYNVKTQSAVTGKAAGVMLYSISSTARASAKEARAAKDKMEEAKKSGKLPPMAELNADNLVKAGYSESEAQKYATAYEVSVAASRRAQEQDVVSGFGSNGGEEFLSYLMTGESLVINGGNEWQKWYETMSGRLVQIQNNDGSWNGHHCITSPVFCTATCVLILSVNKDMAFRVKVR
jgi:hypothetical protein